MDAFDDPNAEADLFTYRNRFRLKQCTSNGGDPQACLRKVDQNGVNLLGDNASPPDANSGWATETSLDLDMVSAMCQSCKILLVEAKSASISDLGIAEDTAARLGANVITNSFGAPASEITAIDPHFNSHPGIVIVASAGDVGYGPEVPAAYPNVISVGGTTLQPASYAESPWVGTGGGCSQISKPSWQSDAMFFSGGACPRRSMNDISAVADPYTPVAMYDTFDSSASSGWLAAGGTSAASPVIAGMFALAGKTSVQKGAMGIWLDGGKHTNHIFGGSNGNCMQQYLCHGADAANPDKPYNGPAGWGTPNGLRAFSVDTSLYH